MQHCQSRRIKKLVRKILQNTFPLRGNGIQNVQLLLKILSTPILSFSDIRSPFILEIDTSFDGLGTVLSQQLESGKVVIAYASRSLRPGEKNMLNFSSLKLERLALKWAITEKFRDYLLESKFVVYTDNNPLSFFKTSKLAANELRWASELALFDFSIRY